MWWVILWIWCETNSLQHDETRWIEEPIAAPRPGDDEWHGGQQDGKGWTLPNPREMLWTGEQEVEDEG